MNKSAIYPGTFDPITNGHLDIIRRAVSIFDRVIIGVADSVQKQPRFNVSERIQLVEDATQSLNNITVCGFSGLLVELAKEQQAQVIVRGLRAVSDFEYELQFANMNRCLAPELETVFLTPSEHLTYISSSLVKEIARMGGDVRQFVPPAVHQALAKE